MTRPSEDIPIFTSGAISSILEEDAQKLSAF